MAEKVFFGVCALYLVGCVWVLLRVRHGAPRRSKRATERWVAEQGGGESSQG